MINNFFTSFKDWGKYHNENKDHDLYMPLAELFPNKVPRTYKNLNYPTNRVLDVFVKEMMKNPSIFFIEAACIWMEQFIDTFSDDQKKDMDKSTAYNELKNKYRNIFNGKDLIINDGKIEFKDYTFREAKAELFYRDSQQDKFINFLLMPIYTMWESIIFFASTFTYLIIISFPSYILSRDWLADNVGICYIEDDCHFTSSEYIPVQLAFDAQKEIPYYFFRFYYKLVELFGGDTQVITIWSFYLFDIILIAIIFSPIYYFIYKFFRA